MKTATKTVARAARGEEGTREPARAAEAEAAQRRLLVPGITRVVDASKPYREASWAARGEPTVVELSNGTRIGGR
ncbi:MAG TPA: hypothetical protein VFZ20_05530, partial [Longimicrobium sp.]